MSHRVDQLVRIAEDSVAYAELGSSAPAVIFQWLSDLAPDELEKVIDRLDWQAPQGTHGALGGAGLLRMVVLWQRREGRGIGPPLRRRILALYKQLDHSSPGRPLLLQWLATAAGVDDLESFVSLILEDPPADDRDVVIAFAPLFQSADYRADILFPKLFTGLGHSALAAPILDLANYLVRQNVLDSHPAESRLGDLMQLAGTLVQRLLLLAESDEHRASAVRDTDETISQCVGLLISLCFTFALIGDRNVIGTLNQVMELPHRRLRAEAASALARLGDERGRDALIDCAAEPISRLRVLADAEDLGLLNQIDEEYKSEQARMEALVVLELAQPAYFGLAPSRIDLLESRTLYWPGFEHPVLCYLFQYAYEMSESEYHNVAVAGPVVHALTCDLNDLPPDDIYAAYAGWHAEHDEILEQPATALTESQRVDVSRLERRLSDAGYSAVRPAIWGSFFGQRVLVALASQGNVPGIAAVDADEIMWLPSGHSRHPLGPHESYCIYKGRRLLKSFNE